MIVLCKASHIYKTTGSTVEVSAFSNYPAYENSIRSLFEATSFVRLIGGLKPHSELIAEVAAGNNSIPHVNSSVLPYIDNGLPADPDWVQTDPYPTFDIEADSVSPGSVVIQLNGGGAHNARGFDIAWVIQVAEELSKDGFVTCIVGTGEGYSDGQIQMLEDSEFTENFIGKTSFEEWIATLANARVVISLEGFAAFFALANKVNTVIFNQYPYFSTAKALHPAWLQHTYLKHLVHLNKYVRRLHREKSRLKSLFSKNSDGNFHSPKGISSLTRFIRGSSLSER